MGEFIEKAYAEDVLENAKVVNDDGTEYKETWLEKLDDFCWEYLPGYKLVYRLWKNYFCPSSLRRIIKHFLQRKFRGFDDSETWDLDTTFYKWLYPRLKRFTEITMAYPCSYDNPQQWKDELNKRVSQLQSIIEINEFDFDDWSYLPKKRIKELKAIPNYTSDMINGDAYSYCVKDFNKWFAENVNQLWW